jgi:hypothetical protein
VNRLPVVLFFLVSALFSLVRGQSEVPIKGHFLVDVDDRTTLYLNGKQIFKAGIGQSQSGDVTLKTGDHLVAQLEDDGGDRHFFLVFQTSDQQAIVSFHPFNFKVVHDVTMIDFTQDQFDRIIGRAGPPTPPKFTSSISIQSSSEAMWGDISKCNLLCVITSTMMP